MPGTLWVQIIVCYPCYLSLFRYEALGRKYLTQNHVVVSG